MCAPTILYAIGFLEEKMGDADTASSGDFDPKRFSLTTASAG